MLKLHEVIPPLTARTPDGRVVQAWDFKQKKSLVIAFLHAGCARCGEFLARLCQHAAEFAEREAVALVVFSETPPARLVDSLPREVVAATDMSGRAQAAFLGNEAIGTARRHAAASVGVFVTDRYGELKAQWVGSEDALPGMHDVLGWLTQAQIACEECGAPHWPLD